MRTKHAVVAAIFAGALVWPALPVAGATCNTSPTALSEAISLEAGQYSWIADVLANDSDIEGQALDVVVVTSTCAPVVSWIVNPTETITVSASAEAPSCQITYRVSDGAGGTALANLTVTVTVSEAIFADGFESGNTSAWSDTVQP